MSNNKLMKKNADIIGDLRSMVRKQAEAQESVKGHPGSDLDFKAPEKKTETVDKNKVKPEDSKNEFGQKSSPEEAGKVVSASEDERLRKLSQDILSTLMKQSDREEEQKSEKSEVQEQVTSTPGKDLDLSGPEKKTETVAKNEVVPEKNENGFGQKSKEEKKVIDEPAVCEPEPTKMAAAKIASYQLGAQLVADLLIASQHVKQAEQIEMLKEAGRRDFETIIDAAAAQLNKAASKKKFEDRMMDEKRMKDGKGKQMPDTSESVEKMEEKKANFFGGLVDKAKSMGGHINETVKKYPRVVAGTAGLLGGLGIHAGVHRAYGKMNKAKEEMDMSKASSINDLAAGILLKSAGIDPEIEKQAEFARGEQAFDEIYKQAEHQALVEKQAELEALVASLMEEKQLREKQAAEELSKLAEEKKADELAAKVTSNIVNKLEDAKSK